ncbi:adenylosuccinate lyase [Chloroflexota bacterium]
MIERYSRPQMKKVWSDKNKFARWLEVEIATCEAWADLGVIPKEAIPKIKQAKINFKRMNEILKDTHHDMTAFLGAIAESLGDESRYVHLGLTSNDVWDTATSLQMVEAARILNKDIEELISVLTEQAFRHKYTPIIGRTHGIHAEPTSFGLKLAIWVEEMKRNLHRLNEAREAISFGKISGAVGTYATLSPELEEKTCAKLGLAPAPVSNQILQRDRHAQFVTTLALIASSLEKFATEIRGLQKTETREVEEPFGASQTGSSAMPHKKNPELCERVSGIARLIRGYALTSMENIPLWHERDISHSSTERITLPDSCGLLDYALSIFTPVMKGLNVYPEQMKRNLEITKGLVFSQRVLLALIDKGLSRQKAYELVQRSAMESWRESRNFLDLLKADHEVSACISAEELGSLFDYEYYLRYVDEIFQRLGITGGPSKKSAGKVPADELAPRSL